MAKAKKVGLKKQLENRLKNKVQNKVIVKKQTHKQKHVYKPQQLYEEYDNILLIGEGNFSFANSLSQKVRTGEKILATSLDTESEVLEKYPEAKDNIEEFKLMGGKVLFGVDCTKLKSYKAIKSKQYDKVVFNFPHVGLGIKDQDRNVEKNQELLFKFFSSCLEAKILRNDDVKKGEVHVTLKSGSPYNLWDVKRLAKQAKGLVTKTTVKFVPSEYPGYNHVRTTVSKNTKADGEKGFGEETLVEKQSKTYIFLIKDDV